MMNDKQFIFIAGVHRSGTSLLHRLIRSHSDISGFENTEAPEDEGQHLQNVLPRNVTAGHFALRRESYMDERHPLAKPETAHALFEEWGQHWDLHKEYLVEKTPRTFSRADSFKSFSHPPFSSSSSAIPLRLPTARKQKGGPGR